MYPILKPIPRGTGALPLVRVFFTLFSVLICTAPVRSESIVLIKGFATTVSDSASRVVMPLFMAVPDTLEGIPVMAWLDPVRSDPGKTISTNNLRFKELSRANREFLLTMKAVFSGDFQSAVEGFADMRRIRYSGDLNNCITNNKAVLFFMTGQPDMAVQDFNLLIEKKLPWCDAAWRNLFSIYFGRGKYKEASRLLDRALKEKPDASWVHVSRGYLISILGSPMELEAYLRDKSSWKDSLFSLQIAYGKLLRRQKEYHQAVKYYSMGLEGEPENGLAWLELSDVYYQLGYFPFSGECMEKALKAGINSPLFFRVVGQLIGERIHDLLRRQMLIDRDRGKCEISNAGYWCFDQIADAKQQEHDMIQGHMRSILEQLVADAPEDRRLVQLLYFCYGALGMKSNAENLRSQMWFHFEVPGIREEDLGEVNFPPRQSYNLRIKFSPTGFNIAMKLLESDFYTVRIE